MQLVLLVAAGVMVGTLPLALAVLYATTRLKPSADGTGALQPREPGEPVVLTHEQLEAMYAEETGAYPIEDHQLSYAQAGRLSKEQPLELEAFE